MEYRIYQTIRNAYVYVGNSELFKLNIRCNLLGLTKLEIFYQGEMILKSSVSTFLLFRYRTIEYQNLEKKIKFEKGHGVNLIVEKDIYRIHWRYWRKKVCIIEKNNEKIAVLTITEKLKWYAAYESSEEHSIFTVFSEDEDTCFYALIRLLIELPMLVANYSTG